MNISPHLLIDIVILSAALTITIVLRAKGNAARKEKESNWSQKKDGKNLKNLNYLIFGTFWFMKFHGYLSFLGLFIFLLYISKSMTHI